MLVNRIMSLYTSSSLNSSRENSDHANGPTNRSFQTVVSAVKLERDMLTNVQIEAVIRSDTGSSKPCRRKGVRGMRSEDELMKQQN